jgi:hypothetical protein
MTTAYPEPTLENTEVRSDRHWDSEDGKFYPVTWATQTLPNGEKLLSRFSEHLHPTIVIKRISNNRKIDLQLAR